MVPSDPPYIFSYYCLSVTYALTRLLCEIYLLILQNLSSLDFDLSRSLKIKCAIGLPILVFNSNTCPNSTPLQDISLQNLSDLELDLSRSNVMVPYWTLHIWFLLVLNGNICVNSAPLRDVRLHNLNYNVPWIWPFNVTLGQIGDFIDFLVFNGNLCPNWLLFEL